MATSNHKRLRHKRARLLSHEALARILPYANEPGDRRNAEIEIAVQGCEAVFSSMLIGTWTAFETLAGDLWETCLNNRPRLGFIALGAEPEQGDDEEKAKGKRKVKYAFPVHLLRLWDYNLRNRMGSLLRKKWDFATRHEAKSAYIKVFGKHKEQLSGIFDDPNLQWIAAIRNALVHSGGVADFEFVKLVEKQPQLSLIKQTKPILLDGALVCGLISPAVVTGVELVKFMDDWLIAHPE